jgi:hypothetical protein
MRREVLDKFEVGRMGNRVREHLVENENAGNMGELLDGSVAF